MSSPDIELRSTRIISVPHLGHCVKDALAGLRRLLGLNQEGHFIRDSIPASNAKPRISPRSSALRLLPPPAPAPTAAKAVATAQQPNYKQKKDGADGGVDDRGDNSGPEMDAELRQQPVANERADNADDEIGDESVSGPPHDLAG
jgi:hypothetical protein